MKVNFWVIEKRLNGGSIYFMQEDYHGEHLFTHDIEQAKRFDTKIEGVTKRSDLGLVSRTTVEEHQLDFTSVEKTAA